MRLNQFLAQATGISRRAADKAIETGHVKINGVKAELGTQVSPSDTVTLAGKAVSAPLSYTYLLFHKPVGYITSRASQGNDHTIYELLPEQYHKLKPVGRLDKDSSGLLLLTDDGELANQLTHPSHQKQKEYQVWLNKPLSEADTAAINRGIELEDGVSHLSMKPLHTKPAGWLVTMSEGRNRQIRRTFTALGYEVTKLHRSAFAGVNIGPLAPGECVETTRKAVL